MINVTLYMAISANGFIAKENDDVEWLSEQSWKSYQGMTRAIRCSVIGRKTYDLMPAEEFLDGCLYIVLTNQKGLKPKHASVVFVSTPQEAIKLAQEKNYSKILVAGGSTINHSFMEQKLIDEVYLDIEPTILGKGIPLFRPENFECKLELLGTKKLNANTIQLHYKVLR
ncbi:hypothetical protein A3A64_02205 [Candidatus Gottesmanbacteria bacterium RIFCSPLOWO2_01_FULL_48_11]|uniref:Dihydrofolate reductase region n=3 Tax=Candidatus Gottesmaniibacteriota TaxID=1752720 RepID=A0A0G1UP00_9BACT|nr:MAG: Dihydrofolate reductase region [Candidatus Gottesmanbacteria bacterium GW2011_GWA2_47_9]KKU95864.1 MAG: Dihydrofolate reductase region [Candidatus Gottesmanbacteria bacterium GW2011_GWA1_48_13]OGG27145.1 MAG: hypothetical protein A3A64_02205 [Candidatus Gottesmanbacteria bacterium RIFCSPLOWO2_01_FULL_48_11]